MGAVRIIVLMGVSGCGKSLIGKALARDLGFEFVEGDEFHTSENKEKMNRGVPLNDEDRMGWLKELREQISKSEKSKIVSCSALKRSYRVVLSSQQADHLFIHLHGPREVIESRIQARTGHFFDPELLTSQFETLEPLEPEERGFLVNVDQAEHLVLAEIISRLDDWET